MKKTILRYGIYSGLLICTLSLISWFLLSELDLGTQELMGYASMVVALSLIFFGIRHFRDRENSGSLSFGEGLRIGLGISLITALCFGILDVIYVKWLNPDFMETYYQTVLADLKASLPPAAFEQRRQEMEAQKALFSSAGMTFLLMFATVFFIGFLISLVSALLLKRKPSETT